jgi:hypothetical protein
MFPATGGAPGPTGPLGPMGSMGPVDSDGATELDLCTSNQMITANSAQTKIPNKASPANPKCLFFSDQRRGMYSLNLVTNTNFFLFFFIYFGFFLVLLFFSFELFEKIRSGSFSFPFQSHLRRA